MLLYLHRAMLCVKRVIGAVIIHTSKRGWAMFNSPYRLRIKAAKIMAMPKSYRFRLGALLAMDNRPGQLWQQSGNCHTCGNEIIAATCSCH